MAFWDIFGTNEKDKHQHGIIHYRLKQLMPDATEEDLIRVACIAGLLARVANVDLKITTDEKEFMKTAMLDWSGLDSKLVEVVCKIAIEEIQELSGLENHLYGQGLRESMDQDDRYRILEVLFAMSAADGSVDNLESEEIRTIAKSLHLTNQHFIAARATVMEKLAALM